MELKTVISEEQKEKNLVEFIEKLKKDGFLYKFLTGKFKKFIYENPSDRDVMHLHRVINRYNIQSKKGSSQRVLDVIQRTINSVAGHIMAKDPNYKPIENIRRERENIKADQARLSQIGRNLGLNNTQVGGNKKYKKNQKTYGRKTLKKSRN